MKERAHSLPSFFAWLNKGFALRAHADQMADARTHPEISPKSVFLALFHSFVFRLASFQQLDHELSHSYLQQWIGSERPFHDDVLRYSLCGFDLDRLETMLVDINRRLKRGKAFDEGRVQGHLVAALDGVEVVSSFSRHCESCLQRRVTLKDPAGRKIEQTQYYHRAVGCQMIHSPVKPFLAIEWVQPGEGEDTAALRLLTRLPDLYGSRFFDILLLDSLYAQTPVLNLVHQIGWEAVISLKQNSRDLYQSAVRLFAVRPPDTQFTEKVDHKTYRVQLWDTEGLLHHRQPGTRAGGALRGSVGVSAVSAGRTDSAYHRPRMALVHYAAQEGLSHSSHSPTRTQPLEEREQWLDGSHQTLGLQTRVSARLPAPPQTDQSRRRARTGPEPRFGSGHADSDDRLRLEFRLRPQALQACPPRPPDYRCRRRSVARLGVQNSTLDSGAFVSPA